MRRRRQKNTLLPKMIGIAVLVNAILLPILAQLGVFKAMKGGQHLIPVQLVQAPPPPPKPKERAKKAKPHIASHKVAQHAAPHAAQRMAHANNTPLIHGLVASGTGGNGDGVTGIVAPGTPITPSPTPTPPPAPTPTPPPVVAQTPTLPPATPVIPQPAPLPILVAATVAHEVDPQIPSDFSDNNLPTTLSASFQVHPDGTATVKLLKSSGSRTLDQIAIQAAQKWTFHPGTDDGKAVESYLRLTINFVQSQEN